MDVWAMTHAAYRRQRIAYARNIHVVLKDKIQASLIGYNNLL